MTIANLDSSKAYGPDCIPLLVVKTYEPQLSSILVKLFNMCLRKSSFLVLQFLYYTFMYFLTMLSKILFLILIVLFSILLLGCYSVIGFVLLGFCFMATVRVTFWTLSWLTRHYRLRYEVTSQFDLTVCDSWFTTRFQIFMTEFFVIMSLFAIK